MRFTLQSEICVRMPAMLQLSSVSKQRRQLMHLQISFSWPDWALTPQFGSASQERPMILHGANKAINVNIYALIVSLRDVSESIVTVLVFAAVIVGALYWYFGTEQGSAIRATGCNPEMSKAQGINIDTMGF